MLINLKTTLLNLTKLALTNNKKTLQYIGSFFTHKKRTRYVALQQKINAKKTPKY
jgi:hypothetical protein